MCVNKFDIKFFKSSFYSSYILLSLHNGNRRSWAKKWKIKTKIIKEQERIPDLWEGSFCKWDKSGSVPPTPPNIIDGNYDGSLEWVSLLSVWNSLGKWSNPQQGSSPYPNTGLIWFGIDASEYRTPQRYPQTSPCKKWRDYCRCWWSRSLRMPAKFQRKPRETQVRT